MRPAMITLLVLTACGGAASDDTGADGSAAADAAPADGARADAATDAGAGDCAALDLGACRQQVGCVATTCLECSCAPVFLGCTASGELPPACPDVDCAQPLCCQAEGDCEVPAECAPPGTPFGCGTCRIEEGNCAVDADCDPSGTGQVCDPIPCSCDGAGQCVAGCGTSGCPTGRVCDLASQRCQPQPCEGSPCPPNFVCGALGESGACFRATCSTGDDCPEGWCVEGACYDSLGECRLPAA